MHQGVGRVAESMGSRIHSNVSTLGFVELLDQSSRVSARLSNALRAAAAQGILPYPTIGTYLEAGLVGRLRMSRLQNIGRKSIAELELLIAEASQYQTMVKEATGSSPDRQIAADQPRPNSSRLSEDSFSELLSKFCGVNPMLVRTIQAAASINALPFPTVGAYLEAGLLGRAKMLQLGGMDGHLLSELDHILAECGLLSRIDAQISLDLNEEASADQKSPTKPVEVSNENLLDLTLGAFIAKQSSVSTRLLNAISIAAASGNCPFGTIADYLRCPTRVAELQKIENLGRRSAVEFEQLVRQSLRAKARQSLAIAKTGYVDVASILEEGLSLLSGRQREVLIERFRDKKTLEAVAVSRNVTRERVRQIEAKSLRILSISFATVLRDSAEAICSKLRKDGTFELPLDEFSRLVSCEAGQSAFYLELVKKFGIAESTLGLSEGNVFIRSHFANRETWKKTVADAINVQPLPLVLENLVASVASVPTFYIRDYFLSRFGPEASTFRNGRNYRTTRMCIDVLRKAGSPLHTSEVRARIFSQFESDIQEHAINAALGRHEEVVITAPGTYALYESLPLSKAQIHSIRNIAHEYLVAQGRFISSKILFDEAFVSRVGEFPPGLSHYLVMGIVQDDERFVTKRGNMIGLATFDVRETYTPLQDEIREIVFEHGPISLREISQRLSNTRRLCNDSGIRLVLSQSPDIIRTGRRTYDWLNRLFENRETYEDVVLAIQISLLEKRKTAFAITQDIAGLELPSLTPHMVESLLSSMDNVVSEGGLHELVNASAELVKYRELSVQALRGRETDMALRSSHDSLTSERLMKLASLDARLLRDDLRQDEPQPNTELTSILRDFSF